MAPIDHLFNSHNSCDKNCCWIKEKCESGDHKECKAEWCKLCKNITPALLCLPCNIGIIHPLPVPTPSIIDTTTIPTNEDSLDVDSSDLLSVTDINGFDHTIKSEINTKEKERDIMRNHKNYYLCKISDAKLYKQICDVYLPNVSDFALRECAHTWDTQLNESLNLSVAKYAEKRKTYSMSMSLTNRVSVAVGIRNEGYIGYWESVFKRIGLKLGASLTETLKNKDIIKQRDNMKKGSVLGKRKRKTDFNATIKELTLKQCEGNKRKRNYRSGMAIGQSANIVEEVVRCTYYPFCKAKESHSSARSKVCDYKDKSPTERKMCLKRIKKMSRKGALEKE